MNKSQMWLQNSLRQTCNVQEEGYFAYCMFSRKSDKPYSFNVKN